MLGITNGEIQHQPDFPSQAYMPVSETAQNTVLLITDTLADLSPFHHTVTNTGVSINTSVKRDNRNSLYFNGSSFLAVANSPGLYKYGPGGSHEWTLEFWMYGVTYKSSNATYFAPINTGDAIAFLHRWYNSANGVHLYATKTSVTAPVYNSSSNIQLAANTSIAANAWHHVAVSYNFESGFKYFIDGVYHPTNGNDRSVLYHETDPNLTTYIGRWRTTNANHYFIGYLQDICVSRIDKYKTAASGFTPPVRITL